MFNRRIAGSLAEFVQGVAGVGAQVVDTCTVYGFALRSPSTGHRVTYVGRENAESHVQSFVMALTAQGGETHRDWHNVPLKLRPFWFKRYYFSAEVGVYELKNVPRSTESALAFALEKIVGQGFSFGGVLALASTDVVMDSATLHRLHDAPYTCVVCGQMGHVAKDHERAPCVICGLRGHAGRDVLCPQLRDEQLPFRSQAIKRKLAALEATTRSSSSSSAALPEESVPEEPALEVEEPAFDEPAPAAAPVRRRIHGKTRSPPGFLPAEAVPLEVVPERRWAHFKGKLQFKCGLRLSSLLRSWSKNSPWCAWTALILQPFRGVTLQSQAGTWRGGVRRGFQVKLPGESPDNARFGFRVCTEDSTMPCNSAQCWFKLAGEPLQFCGKDCCAYAAAVACKQEHMTARPDRRKRQRADADDDPAEDQEAALTAWRIRWRVIRPSEDT